MDGIPDKMLCQVSGNNEVNRVEEGKEWYCHLHGKGNHSTKFCEVVKLLKSKGAEKKLFPIKCVLY